MGLYVYQYVNRFKGLINSKQGQTIRDLLSLLERPSGAISSQNKQKASFVHEVTPKLDLSSTVSRLQDFWKDLIQSHIEAYLALHRNPQAPDWIGAYEAQSKGVSKFVSVLRNEDGWVLPVLYQLIYDLRMLGSRADRVLESQGKKKDRLEDAARLLNTCYGVTMNDRAPSESSKKWGTLYVVNSLFAIYFELANIRLCRNLIQGVESVRFPDLEEFPPSERVTYKYYVGRYSLFDSKYKKAAADLNYAFALTPRYATANKRAILYYLIPVQLLLGKIPKPSLLTKYQLPCFQGLAMALRQGNIKAFRSEMMRYQSIFISKGIYLILEKLQIIVLRNLFKKISVLEASSRLPLTQVQKAFAWMGLESQLLDLDEIECLFANLIGNDYVKGYISHGHRIVVLSKANPFPALDSVAESSS